MGTGFVEVITLLLGLSGFGLQPNINAPTPDGSLQYAMPDADLVVHFDAVSVIPSNYKVLQQLPNNPGIKGSPDLSKMIRKAIGEVEGARGLAKAATGIDLTTDVSDATVFVQFRGKQDPNFIAVVHGKFSAGNIEKIAKATKGAVVKVGSASMIETGSNDPAIGVTKDGVLIAGTPSLVKARLQDAWKAPARAANSNLAYAAEVLGQKPVFALVATLSPGTRKFANDEIRGKNFATDLITRHKVAAYSVFHDGIGWTWIDNNKGGLDSMEMMSQGLIELFRAGHIAPRGMAKIILGGLDSYKGSDKKIDAVIARKADLVKIVETYTGDGNFKATVNKDAKALKLSVRLSGKTLSEVVPAGLLLPGAMFAFLTRGDDYEDRMSAPPPPISVPPAPPKGGLGAPKTR